MGSGNQLIIINSQKSCAARIEDGRIISHTKKITGCQPSLSIQADLVQHSSKIDQAFRLAVIAAWSLSLHAKKSFRPCGKVSTVHLARKGHTTLARACGGQPFRKRISDAPTLSKRVPSSPSLFGRRNYRN